MGKITYEIKKGAYILNKDSVYFNLSLEQVVELNQLTQQIMDKDIPKEHDFISVGVPGMYDTTRQCTKCGVRYMDSIDAPQNPIVNTTCEA